MARPDAAAVEDVLHREVDVDALRVGLGVEVRGGVRVGVRVKGEW